MEVTGVQEDTRTEQVFNLEVANNHTFFVGDDGVLAHNGGRAREFTRKQLEDQYTRDPYCFYCGKRTIRCKKPRPNRYNGDHYDSHKNGGTNSDDNLVTSCQACNLDKGAQNGDDYVRRRRGR
jgi:5-methylcytosine-specific restriction endonuclease McrA